MRPPRMPHAAGPAGGQCLLLRQRRRQQQQQWPSPPASKQRWGTLLAHASIPAAAVVQVLTPLSHGAVLCCCFSSPPIHCSCRAAARRQDVPGGSRRDDRTRPEGGTRQEPACGRLLLSVGDASTPSHAAAGCCGAAVQHTPNPCCPPACRTHSTTPHTHMHHPPRPLRHCHCSPCSHPEDVWAILSKDDLLFAKSARMTATREWLGDGVFTQLDPHRHAQHMPLRPSACLAHTHTHTRWQTGQRCTAAPWWYHASSSSQLSAAM